MHDIENQADENERRHQELERDCSKCEYAVNKDGKTLFFIDDGENWWYLGEDIEQVEKYHIDSYCGEKVEIDTIKPMTIESAKKIMISLEETDEAGDQKTVALIDFIDNAWHYDNGVALVAGSVY